MLRLYIYSETDKRTTNKITISKSFCKSPPTAQNSFCGSGRHQLEFNLLTMFVNEGTYESGTNFALSDYIAHDFTL